MFFKFLLYLLDKYAFDILAISVVFLFGSLIVAVVYAICLDIQLKEEAIKALRKNNKQ